jgi:hypothetical protein
MADKRWRGAVFDLGVGLVFVAVLSGPIIWAAGVVHRGVKYGLRAAGVL